MRGETNPSCAILSSVIRLLYNCSLWQYVYQFYQTHSCKTLNWSSVAVAMKRSDSFQHCGTELLSQRKQCRNGPKNRAQKGNQADQADTSQQQNQAHTTPSECTWLGHKKQASTNLEHRCQQWNECCVGNLTCASCEEKLLGFSTLCVKNSKQAVRQNTAGSLSWRCRAGTHWDVCLHCEESITPDSVSGPSHCLFTKGGEVEPYSVDRYTSLL